jgi:hypothetical protein
MELCLHYFSSGVRFLTDVLGSKKYSMPCDKFLRFLRHLTLSLQTEHGRVSTSSADCWLLTSSLNSTTVQGVAFIHTCFNVLSLVSLHLFKFPVTKIPTRNFNLLDIHRRSQQPRCIRCGCATARFLRLWVRISPRTWMFASCDYCVLSEIFALGWALVQRSPTARARVCVCFWVWLWILDNEGALAHWGLLRRVNKYKIVFGKYIKTQDDFVLNISENNNLIPGK